MNAIKRILLFWLGRGMRWFDFSGVQRIADCVGFLMWVFLFKRREETVRRIMHHLQVAEEKARPIARASFFNTARSFMEIFLNKRFRMDYVHVENPHLLETMIAQDRAGVLVTAHFGSWELMGSLISHTTHRPTMTVARQQKDKVVSEFIKELRGESRIASVDHRSAAGPALQCLRNHGLVGFFVDHNTQRQEAIFLPFMQDTAAVNIGPALLAVRAKAVVYPLFLRRDGLYTYTLSMDDPLDTQTLEGTLSEKIRQVAVFYTKAVEKKVLENPEQWLWIHRRWKTRAPQDTQPKIQNTQSDSASEA